MHDNDNSVIHDNDNSVMHDNDNSVMHDNDNSVIHDNDDSVIHDNEITVIPVLDTGIFMPSLRPALPLHPRHLPLSFQNTLWHHP